MTPEYMLASEAMSNGYDSLIVIEQPSLQKMTFLPSDAGPLISEGPDHELQQDFLRAVVTDAQYSWVTSWDGLVDGEYAVSSLYVRVTDHNGIHPRAPSAEYCITGKHKAIRLEDGRPRPEEATGLVVATEEVAENSNLRELGGPR